MSSSSRNFYKLAVHVWCTPDQLADLEGSIVHLLCPDPDHDGPCEIPWEVSSEDVDLKDVPKDIIAEIETFHRN